LKKLELNKKILLIHDKINARDSQLYRVVSELLGC